MTNTPVSPLAKSSRSVVKSVYAAETPEGVGATVRRSIGSSALRNLSPFLMLDHARLQPGAGFPDHPHRGQTTVSYVLCGMTQHEDFLGNAGTLEKGDVQWMTAGRGIMHSEMPLFDPAKAEDVEALQLWVDLPAEQKMIEPSYQEKKAADITTVRPSEGVGIVLISGESHGAKGFVRPVGGCWLMDFKLQRPGASVFQPIPAGWTAFVYLISGNLQVGDKEVSHDKYYTLVLSSTPGEEGVRLTRPSAAAAEETRFVLIAGEPLDQPVVQYGPFVLNSEKQVREAIMDYRGGKNGFERAPGWTSEIGKATRA